MLTPLFELEQVVWDAHLTPTSKLVALAILYSEGISRKEIQKLTGLGYFQIEDCIREIKSIRELREALL